MSRFNELAGLSESHSKRDVTKLEVAYYQLVNELRSVTDASLTALSGASGDVIKNAVRVTPQKVKQIKAKMHALESEIKKLKRSAE